jgi:hypothetical protein
MPMKCMDQTPQPSARLPVASIMARRPRVPRRACAATCNPIHDENMATRIERITSDGA